MKDTDFLFLTAMLRSREAKMLSKDKIDRMLDALSFDDAAKILMDCGYPDMSGMTIVQTEGILSEHRDEIFCELSNNKNACCIADLFRMKFDYHNVKVLVKSMASNDDASGILSGAGRVGASIITEAFISGERGDIPPALKDAMSEAVGILSRTSDPQLADIATDKAYFSELLSLALSLDDEFIIGYVRLLIDSANLRTFVRSSRIGRDVGFLETALIPGGNIDVDEIVELCLSGAAITDIFKSDALEPAIRMGTGALGGGTQTQFELACDNAVLYYISAANRVSFGPAPVVAYFVKLEWEVTAVRMILTGKLAGIAPDIIRERLRDCHV